MLDYISDGENKIVITTKTVITVVKNEDHDSKNLEQVVVWSKPKEIFVTTSNATLNFASTSAALVDKKAYIFSGGSVPVGYSPSTDT